MKKILLFGLACVLALGIFSCASEDDEKNSETEKTAKTEKTDQDDDDDKEADVLTPATAPDYASGSFTAFGSGWNLGNALDACYYVDKNSLLLLTLRRWKKCGATQMRKQFRKN